MRILHIAPLWFRVARSSAGGIETFLATLIDEQVRQGCDVTLLATGDSRTAAPLVEVTPVGAVDAMAEGLVAEYTYLEQDALALAMGLERDVDVVHSHLGAAAFGLGEASRMRGRLLHTHHNEITPDLVAYVGRHPDLWITTPSGSAARPLREAGARRCTVVPNGIDLTAFPLGLRPHEGLVFLGRIEHAKGADLAIAAARATGRPLVLAGPVVDDAYFDQVVAPELGGQIRYAGVLNHEQKCALLAESTCAIVPSRCLEGFGMVAVEAMACGTPVVSSGQGALADVVEDGITGYNATAAEMAGRVEQAAALDRRTVAVRARERFGIARAAASYLALYRSALEPSALVSTDA